MSHEMIPPALRSSLFTPAGAASQAYQRSPSVVDGDSRLVAGRPFAPPTTDQNVKVPCCIGCGQGTKRPSGSHHSLCINHHCGRRAWAHHNCIGGLKHDLKDKDKKKLPLAFEDPDEVPDAVDAWKVVEGRLSILQTLALHSKIGLECDNGVFSEHEGQELLELLPKCLPHVIPGQEDMVIQLFLTGFVDSQLVFACSHECKVQAHLDQLERNATIDARGLRQMQAPRGEVPGPFSTEPSAGATSVLQSQSRIGDLPVDSLMNLVSQDEDLNALLEQVNLDEKRLGPGAGTHAMADVVKPFLNVVQNQSLSSDDKVSVIGAMLQGDSNQQVQECFQAGGWCGPEGGFEGTPGWSEIARLLKRLTVNPVPIASAETIVPLSGGGGTHGEREHELVGLQGSTYGEVKDASVLNRMGLNPDLSAFLDSRGASLMAPLLKQHGILNLATLKLLGTKEDFGHSAAAGGLSLGDKVQIQSLLPSRGGDVAATPSRAVFGESEAKAAVLHEKVPTRAKGEAVAEDALLPSWKVVLAHCTGSSKPLTSRLDVKQVGDFFKSYQKGPDGGSAVPVQPPVDLMRQFFDLENTYVASITGTMPDSLLLYSGSHIAEVEGEWGKQFRSGWWGSVTGSSSEVHFEQNKLVSQTRLKGKVLFLQTFDRAQLEYWFMFWEARLIEMDQNYLLPILLWLKRASLARDIANMGGGDGIWALGSVMISDSAADGEHEDRLTNLTIFRQSVMAYNHGSRELAHPLATKARFEQDKLRLALTNGRHALVRPFKRVSYVLPTQVANLAPDDMWDESICLNCNARDDHMTLLCKKPRKDNLLCCICLAGCHAERDCMGPPGHVVPASYFKLRREQMFVRVQIKVDKTKGSKSKS